MSARPDLLGAMYSDGERAFEIVGYDGTDPRGGFVWLIADLRDPVDASPRDRPSRRVTQNELDAMTRLGFAPALQGDTDG